MARYARIVGTGRYLPEEELSNAEFAARMDRLSPVLAR